MAWGVNWDVYQISGSPWAHPDPRPPPQRPQPAHTTTAGCWTAKDLAAAGPCPAPVAFGPGSARRATGMRVCWLRELVPVASMPMLRFLLLWFDARDVPAALSTWAMPYLHTRGCANSSQCTCLRGLLGNPKCRGARGGLACLYLPFQACLLYVMLCPCFLASSTRGGVVFIHQGTAGGAALITRPQHSPS